MRLRRGFAVGLLGLVDDGGCERLDPQDLAARQRPDLVVEAPRDGARSRAGGGSDPSGVGPKPSARTVEPGPASSSPASATLPFSARAYRDRSSPCLLSSCHPSETPTNPAERARKPLALMRQSARPSCHAK